MNKIRPSYYKKYMEKLIDIMPIRLICRLVSIRAKGKLLVGKDSFVHKSVHVIGKSNISLGSNSFISEGCWLNVNKRNGTDIEISIGNNVFVGKNNFFTSGEKIIISDYVLTAYGCNFIGASHVNSDPMTPYIASGTTANNVIDIGVNCFIGANATILGNVKIGHGSIVGAGTCVTNDIQPFSIVVGNPSKVISRFSFERKIWVPVEKLLEGEINMMPSAEEYLISIEGRYPKIRMPLIALGRDMGNL